MKLHTHLLLEHIIDEGIKDGLVFHGDEQDKEVLANKISEYIWLGLDYYFDFEDE